MQRKFVHSNLATRNCMYGSTRIQLDQGCNLILSCRIDAQNLIKVADFRCSEEIYARNDCRQEAASNKEGQAAVKLPVKWRACMIEFSPRKLMWCVWSFVKNS